MKLWDAGLVKIMSDTPFEELPTSDDELLAEYAFDYKQARPNCFAARNGKQILKGVVLDEDVAQAFTTAALEQAFLGKPLLSESSA